MSVRAKKVSAGDTKQADPLPPLEPSREVGWFFKNGQTVAIERHENETRGDEEGN
jgi:hypothetical protein